MNQSNQTDTQASIWARLAELIMTIRYPLDYGASYDVAGETSGMRLHARDCKQALIALLDLEVALLAADAGVLPAQAPHRCSGCGHRWEVPTGFILNGAELCGDCWRKAQSVLHLPSPAEPQQACSEPAPDRSGRSCDKPKGHSGYGYGYGCSEDQ